MPAIIALVLIATVALAVLGFAATGPSRPSGRTPARIHPQPAEQQGRYHRAAMDHLGDLMAAACLCGNDKQVTCRVAPGERELFPAAVRAL